MDAQSSSGDPADAYVSLDWHVLELRCDIVLQCCSRSYMILACGTFRSDTVLIDGRRQSSEPFEASMECGMVTFVSPVVACDKPTESRRKFNRTRIVSKDND